MNDANDIIQAEKRDDDVSVRPAKLEEFIGQKEVVENLQVYLKAAQLRDDPIDHILFSGPPGLGKTTLARILSEAQGSNFHQISAPNLKRPGDIAKLLTTLERSDVLFIDEIHRLPAPVEEVLYTAMEDRFIDITLSDGLGASSVKIDLPPYTLVGATTRPGSLSGPLRDRFGIHLRLDFYTDEDLLQILKRSCKIWSIEAGDDGLMSIAVRSRKTPRIALRLLRRVWDYVLVSSHELGAVKKIETEFVKESFQKIGIDDLGLTKVDNQVLKVIAENYKGGPVGLKPIASIIAEDIITLEDFIEPHLVRIGFIERTSRGRILSKKGFSHIGKNINENDGTQSLF